METPEEILTRELLSAEYQPAKPEMADQLARSSARRFLKALDDAGYEIVAKKT